MRNSQSSPKLFNSLETCEQNAKMNTAVPLFGSDLHIQRSGDEENLGPKGLVLRYHANAEAGLV